MPLAGPGRTGFPNSEPRSPTRGGVSRNNCLFRPWRRQIEANREGERERGGESPPSVNSCYPAAHMFQWHLSQRRRRLQRPTRSRLLDPPCTFSTTATTATAPPLRRPSPPHSQCISSEWTNYRTFDRLNEEDELAEEGEEDKHQSLNQGALSHKYECSVLFRLDVLKVSLQGEWWGWGDFDMECSTNTWAESIQLQ